MCEKDRVERGRMFIIHLLFKVKAFDDVRRGICSHLRESGINLGLQIFKVTSECIKESDRGQDVERRKANSHNPFTKILNMSICSEKTFSPSKVDLQEGPNKIDLHIDVLLSVIFVKSIISCLECGEILNELEFFLSGLQAEKCVNDLVICDPVMSGNRITGGIGIRKSTSYIGCKSTQVKRLHDIVIPGEPIVLATVEEDATASIEKSRRNRQQSDQD